ncbi:MAG: alpha-L-rhamnosidase C-terminal domain-containing protein [Saprospiraceae bacterium]|nr:alpha-L-rhamnosidase C-terminal domain-containing protein [Saprospiraceae bacterium]
MKIIPTLCFLAFSSLLQAQYMHPDILKKSWQAHWIAVPGEHVKDYGVYLFRKSLDLSEKRDSFIIHVSADNRYKLFVNGKLASHGPARGDFFHWYFETVNIAPFLQNGKNQITAVVWNDGEWTPMAQMSLRTAFILQGNTEKEAVLNTNKSWKCIRDESYKPLPADLIYTYYVAGPGELIDMNLAKIGWKNTDYNDSNWKDAAQLEIGVPKGVFDWAYGWMLVPRPIPQMELTPQRLQKTRKVEGVQVPSVFPAQKAAFSIPPNTMATILLDQTFLTNAYPTLVFSKGKNALISLSYAEGLYVNEGIEPFWKAQRQKGNRNEIEGKRFVGKEDRIISNGADYQEFTSLWWRTYRYLQVKIQTKAEALVIEDLYGTFTGYPFEFTAKFDAGDPSLNQIMDIAWRTARLCANETYMDTPYYEQLQYVGDTRIQCLVSLYNSGDERLMRHAIDLIDYSRIAEGITMSRYPTAQQQIIPPFSLWWIAMLHDYWMYRPDADFVKNKLPGMRQVLHFFNQYQQGDGSLKNVPYWNFTDWCEAKGWSGGVAPTGKDGNSAALDFQLLWSYQTAATLEKNLGSPENTALYEKNAAQLQQTIREKYWDAQKQLFADTPEKTLFSQHVNALAILTNTTSNAEAKSLANKILTDTSLAQATIYFKYYVNQSLIKAGLGSDYLNWLGDWKNNLHYGMTTLAEISDVNRTRSDSHAWGAHPNIEFLRTVLGIDSAAPGFQKVKIEPHLGNLTNASGSMPHPKGTISTHYKQEKNNWTAEISLPQNTPGVLIWKGKEYLLKAGEKTIIKL